MYCDKTIFKIIFSFLFGIFDYVLDLYVYSRWFSTGNLIWGILGLCFVIFSGSISCIFFKKFRLYNDYSTKTYAFIILLHFCGLGFLFESYHIANSGFENEFINNFMKQRMIQSIFQAIPSGVLQLFIFIYMRKLDDNIFVVSIMSSIFSFGFGVTNIFDSKDFDLGSDSKIGSFIRAYWLFYVCFWVLISTDFFLRIYPVILILNDSFFLNLYAQIWVPISYLLLCSMITMIFDSVYHFKDLITCLFYSIFSCFSLTLSEILLPKKCSEKLILFVEYLPHLLLSCACFFMVKHFATKEGENGQIDNFDYFYVACLFINSTIYFYLFTVKTNENHRHKVDKAQVMAILNPITRSVTVEEFDKFYGGFSRGNINNLKHFEHFEGVDKQGTTPFHLVCENPLVTVKILMTCLEYSGDLNAHSEVYRGQTPFMRLCHNCQDANVIRVALNFGANPRHRDDLGRSALFHATYDFWENLDKNEVALNVLQESVGDLKKKTGFFEDSYSDETSYLTEVLPIFFSNYDRHIRNSKSSKYVFYHKQKDIKRKTQTRETPIQTIHIDQKVKQQNAEYISDSDVVINNSDSMQNTMSAVKKFTFSDDHVEVMGAGGKPTLPSKPTNIQIPNIFSRKNLNLNLEVDNNFPSPKQEDAEGLKRNESRFKLGDTTIEVLGIGDNLETII